MNDPTRLSATLLNSHFNLPEICNVIGQLLRQFPHPHCDLKKYPNEKYLMAKGDPCTYGSVARPTTEEDFQRDEVVGSEEVGGGDQEEGRSFGA